MPPEPQPPSASASTPASGGRFFVTGGTIPPGAPSYIERAADRQLLEALRAGEFCHVLTPRQMGKSSLMVRTAQRLRGEGFDVVRLDLTGLGQNLTPEQWYDGMLATAGAQLGCEDEFDAFWEEHRRLGPCQRFFAALRELLRLRGAAGRPLVVFVDELDTVRSLPFPTDEFFAAVRQCHNRRADEPEFARLTFCLLGVATPSDLIRDARITPFNIGRRIELHDFTREEMRSLAPGLPVDGPATAEALLRAVYHWTHGQPYLTQRLCEAIAARSGSPLVRGRARSTVAAACDELFLSPAARIQDDNLHLLRERLLRGSPDRAAVLTMYRRVLRGWPPVRHDETDAVAGVLRLAGVVRVRSGRLQIRNRIYARVFDVRWIESNMPDAELRLQRAAYWRGVMRATGVGLLAVAVFAGIGLWLRERARRREQSASLIAARGLNRLERGDLLDALPHFVEALESERPGSAGEEIARLRIAALLQEAPNPDLLLRHERGVTASAITGDGRRLATVEDRGAVRLWDLTNGTVIGRPLETGLDAAWIGFDAREQRVVVRGERQLELAILDVGPEGLQARHRIERVRGAALFGERLLVGFADGELAFADLETGVRETLYRHSNEVSQVVVSENSARAAYAAGAGQLWLFDLAARRPLAGPMVHELPPKSHLLDVAIAPDGRAAVTCGMVQTAYLWRFDGGSVRRLPLAHENWVYSASFSPDGRRVVTASADCDVAVWDAADGRRLALLRHEHDVYHAAFDSTGKRVVTTGASGAVAVWNPADGELAMPLLYHATFALGALFVPVDERVVTFSMDRTVRVWSPPPPITAGGTALGVVDRRPQGVTVSDGGHFAAVWQEGDGGGSGVSFWKLDQPTAPVASVALPAPVRLVSLADDGSAAAIARADGQVALWEERRGVVWTMAPAGASNTVTAVALADTGGRLAVAWSDGSLRVRERGRPESEWPARIAVGMAGDDEPESVSCLQFSSDGRRLAAGTSAGGVSLFDAGGGRLLGRRSRAETRGLSAERIRFSPVQPDLVAVAFSSGELEPGGVLLWNLDHGAREPVRWLPHRDGVRDLAFRPDGRTLATASEDGTVGLWEVATGEAVAPPFRGRYQATAVSFSQPDGLLLFGLWRQEAGGRLFDSRTLALAGPPFRFGAVPREARFLPGAEPRRILISFGEGPPRIFTLPQIPGPMADLQRWSRLLAPRLARPREGSLGPTAADMYETWRDLHGTWGHRRASAP